jgi:hypothetical protein
LYSTPNTIRVILSKGTRLAEYMARMGENKIGHGVWWGNLKEKVHLENTRVEVRIKMDLKETGWQGVDLSGWLL